MGGKDPFSHLDAEGSALHERSSDVARMLAVVMLIAALIWGLCAGLRWAVHHASEHLLHDAGHGGWLGWGVLLGVLAAGGFVRAWLMERPVWRQTRGDGVGEALANYHVTYEHEADDPQPRYERPAFALAWRKAVATFLTLGTGASGGLEAPSVLIGEAAAAGVSRRLRVVSEHELRTYQLSGIAAAVATLIGAPFTAALFAIEIAYTDRIIYRKFAYALLAGLVAHVLNQNLVGASPIFIAPGHERVYSTGEYGLAALVAVAVSAPVALGFGLVMRRAALLVSRFHPLLHGVAGAVGAGMIALCLWLGVGMDPLHVLGMGEWTLAILLSEGVHLPWWFLLIAVVGKMLTTGLTVQSGGSAGLLIPSMFLGGVSGAFVGELLFQLGLTAAPGVAIYVIVGIASALVAVIGVPLAAIALVLEVFGPSYGPPTVLACVITYVSTLHMRVYATQRVSPNPDAD